MAVNEKKVTTFEGIVSNKNSSIIPDNAFTDIENMDLDIDGHMVKRLGFKDANENYPQDHLLGNQQGFYIFTARFWEERMEENIRRDVVVERNPNYYIGRLSSKIPQIEAFNAAMQPLAQSVQNNLYKAFDQTNEVWMNAQTLVNNHPELQKPTILEGTFSVKYVLGFQTERTSISESTNLMFTEIEQIRSDPLNYDFTIDDILLDVELRGLVTNRQTHDVGALGVSNHINFVGFTNDKPFVVRSVALVDVDSSYWSNQNIRFEFSKSGNSKHGNQAISPYLDRLDYYYLLDRRPSLGGSFVEAGGGTRGKVNMDARAYLKLAYKYSYKTNTYPDSNNSMRTRIHITQLGTELRGFNAYEGVVKVGGNPERFPKKWRIEGKVFQDTDFWEELYPIGGGFDEAPFQSYSERKFQIPSSTTVKYSTFALVVEHAANEKIEINEFNIKEVIVTTTSVTESFPKLYPPTVNGLSAPITTNVNIVNGNIVLTNILEGLKYIKIGVDDDGNEIESIIDIKDGYVIDTNWQGQKNIGGLIFKDELLLATGSGFYSMRYIKQVDSTNPENDNVLKLSLFPMGKNAHKPTSVEVGLYGINILSENPYGDITDTMSIEPSIAFLRAEPYQGIANEPVEFRAYIYFIEEDRIDNPTNPALSYRFFWKIEDLNDNSVIFEDKENDQNTNFNGRNKIEYKFNSVGRYSVNVRMFKGTAALIDEHNFIIEVKNTVRTKYPETFEELNACRSITIINDKVVLWNNGTANWYVSVINNSSYFSVEGVRNFDLENGKPLTMVSNSANTGIIVATEGMIKMVFGRGDIVQVEGFDFSPFQAFQAQNIVDGCIGPAAFTTFENTIVYLSGNGLYFIQAVTSNEKRIDIVRVNQDINDIMIKEEDACMVYFDNRLIISYPSKIRLDDEGNEVNESHNTTYVFNKGKWSKWTGTSQNFNDFKVYGKNLYGLARNKLLVRQQPFENDKIVTVEGYPPTYFTDDRVNYGVKILSKLYTFEEEERFKKLMKFVISFINYYKDVNYVNIRGIADGNIILFDNNINQIGEMKLGENAILGEMTLGYEKIFTRTFRPTNKRRFKTLQIEMTSSEDKPLVISNFKIEYDLGAEDNK